MDRRYSKVVRIVLRLIPTAFFGNPFYYGGKVCYPT